MLEQSKINEYTKLLKECETAKQEAQKINTEISMLKKQGMEKLQEFAASFLNIYPVSMINFELNL